MERGNSIISVLALIVSVITLAMLAFMFFAGGNQSGPADITTQKSLAGELEDNNLYQAAIDEYKKILDNPEIENDAAANIYYMIGRIYFDNLSDYNNAAAYYIRARTLNPNGSFYDEAGKNLIACMEKMGRILDAKRELDKTVNIDSVYDEHEGETVIAKIGDNPVYMSDVKDNIQNLPPETQKQFLSKEGKIDAVNGYIGMELIYRAAVREGYNTSPEMVKLTERLTRQAIVDKYLKDKVMVNLRIDDNDVKNYYEANKSTKYNDKAFDEVKDRVYQDYKSEKSQQVFQNYVNNLASVENVKIFEDKIK